MLEPFKLILQTRAAGIVSCTCEACEAFAIMHWILFDQMAVSALLSALLDQVHASQTHCAMPLSLELLLIFNRHVLLPLLKLRLFAALNLAAAEPQHCLVARWNLLAEKCFSYCFPMLQRRIGVKRCSGAQGKK